MFATRRRMVGTISRTQLILAACRGALPLASLCATRRELETVRWLTFLYRESPLEVAAVARNREALAYMQKAGVRLTGFEARQVAQSLRSRPGGDTLAAELAAMKLLAE